MQTLTQERFTEQAASRQTIRREPVPRPDRPRLEAVGAGLECHALVASEMQPLAQQAAREFTVIGEQRTVLNIERREREKRVASALAADRASARRSGTCACGCQRAVGGGTYASKACAEAVIAGLQGGLSAEAASAVDERLSDRTDALVRRFEHAEAEKLVDELGRDGLRREIEPVLGEIAGADQELARSRAIAHADVRKALEEKIANQRRATTIKAARAVRRIVL